MTEPSLVASFSVSPLYAQVSISDSECQDYPEWDEGDEQVISSPGCIAVATREDRLGPVEIQIYRALEPGATFPNFTRIYSGGLELPSRVMIVGSVAGGSERGFQLAESVANIALWVDVVDAPASLRVVIEPSA